MVSEEKSHVREPESASKPGQLRSWASLPGPGRCACSGREDEVSPPSLTPNGVSLPPGLEL